MIKIFVSSTFSDMQSERDIIQTKVLPRLKRDLLPQGIDVQFVDLRWGISNESIEKEDVMEKILNICVEEIETCKPFFVLLLGNRYGTIPNPAIVDSFLKKHKDISPEQITDKSITEIEYLCSEINNKVPTQYCICLRDDAFVSDVPDSIKPIYIDKDIQKIKEFKKKVKDTYPDSVINYSPKWSKKSNSLTELNALGQFLLRLMLLCLSHY